MKYEVGGFISVGEGWRPVVEDLIRLCEKHNVTVDQIKEKFGGLAFYHGIIENDPDTYQIINAAIRRAYEICNVTCELCGKAGTKVRPHWWIKTLCPEHAKEYEETVNTSDVVVNEQENNNERS